MGEQRISAERSSGISLRSGCSMRSTTGRSSDERSAHGEGGAGAQIHDMQQLRKALERVAQGESFPAVLHLSCLLAETAQVVKEKKKERSRK